MSTTLTGVTAPSKVDQAQGIRREVTEAAWPDTREARWAIGWALGDLTDALALHAALLNDDTGPWLAGFPGMDRDGALEAAADEALERAKAARNRLSQAWADEKTRQRKAAEAAGLAGDASNKGEAA